jgi:DNA mismatch repair ATPase MutS
VVLLEQGRFSSPRLALLQTQLRETGSQASTAIAHLRRIIEMHDWQHNMVFAPVAFFLMWSIHLAWALEAWRARHGTHVHAWLRIIGEFEALASLSAYAFEHPADPFPVFTSAEGQARFEGTGLGHPLVAASRMQTNDVSLTPDRQLLVVSGSNMSGKSTFLRTVGINAVLAQAGAPVRALSLHMSALTVGATLRIQDSLQEGRSRFFAEITRIRELAGLARGPVPLLFLLDEIFHGTNSHDRLVGASGVLRSLLDRRAIGLVTTHDLSLTAIVESLGSRAANVHFEDSFDGRDMHFDYRVKPGPVTKSNALALMRAVGLDVDDAGSPPPARG